MTSSSSSISEALLLEFSHLIADRMGLFFPKSSLGEFEQKLKPMAKAFGFTNLASCLRSLLQTELSQQQLAEISHYLTIGETYFFRDKAAFTALEEKILPAIIEENRHKKTLKIWSAACCTGEEPYSIAMLLRQLLPDIENWDIFLLGTDINPHFLKKAEEGIYKEWSFRALPLKYKQHYFTKKGERYLLDNQIKRMAAFAQLNLAEDPFPCTRSGHFDLILCNNVLIYFTLPVIQQCIKKITLCLDEKGWLVVSPIEVPYVHEEHLRPEKLDGQVVFRKDSFQHLKEPQREKLPYKTGSLPSHPSSTEEPLLVELPAFLELTEPVLVFNFSKPPRPQMPSSPSQTEPIAAHKKPENKLEKPENKQELYERLVAGYEQGDYQNIIPLLEQVLTEAHTEAELKWHLEEITLLAKCYANIGNSKKALYWCQKALATDKLLPHLHYLHGTIVEEMHDMEQAAQDYKRALYLEPNFIMAHYSLGNVLKRLGKKSAAEQSFRNARQLLAGQANEAILPGSESLSAAQLKDILSH